jgi:hypothetical protein
MRCRACRRRLHFSLGPRVGSCPGRYRAAGAGQVPLRLIGLMKSRSTTWASTVSSVADDGESQAPQPAPPVLPGGSVTALDVVSRDGAASGGCMRGLAAAGLAARRRGAWTRAGRRRRSRWWGCPSPRPRQGRVAGRTTMATLGDHDLRGLSVAENAFGLNRQDAEATVTAKLVGRRRAGLPRCGSCLPSSRPPAASRAARASRSPPPTGAGSSS